MKLTACVVLMDGQQTTVERCLSSVREYVDEILITDTSTNTSAGAGADAGNTERYGAATRFLPWDGDPAKARGASMEGASGDWLLLLFADEFLRVGDGSRMREACENAMEDDSIPALQMELLYMPGGDLPAAGFPPGGAGREYSLGMSIRLVRRAAGLSFAGPLFETPVYPGTGAPPKAPVAPLAALCRGALSEPAALVEFVERRVAEYPQNPGVYLMRGFQHKRVGRPLKMLQDFERAVDMRYRALPNETGMPPLDDHYPPALYDCGVMWAALGDYRRAVDRLLSALRAQSLTGSPGFDYHKALRRLVSYTKVLPEQDTIGVLTPFAGDFNALTRLVNILRSERPDSVFIHFCEQLYRRTRQRDSNYITVQIITGEYAAAVSALIARYRVSRQDTYAYRALVAALLANHPGLAEAVGHEAVNALLLAYAGRGPVEPYREAYLETAGLLLGIGPDSVAAGHWITMGMESPDLAEQMGILLSSHGRHKTALSCFRRARWLYGDKRADIFEKLAFCAYRAGLYEDVADYAEAALKRGADMRRLEPAVYYAAHPPEGGRPPAGYEPPGDSIKQRLIKLLPEG